MNNYYITVPIMVYQACRKNFEKYLVNLMH